MRFVVPVRPVENFVRFLVKKIRIAVLGRFPFDPFLLARRERRLQRAGDFTREIALDREHVGELAIVNLGPEMTIVCRVDELNVDPDAFPFAADAALENGRHVQGLPNLANVVLLAAIRQH